MKSISRLVLLALPLLPLVPARAEFNPALVSADAKWLVYADLNALRASTIGKEIVIAAEKAQMAATDGKIGIDIPKVFATIGSLTAYGTNFSDQPAQMDGALIVQGTADLRKIAESLLLQQTLINPTHVVELKDFPYPAYGFKAGPPPPATAAKDAAKAGDAMDAKQEPKAPAAKAPAAKADPNKIELFVAFPPEPIVLVSRSKAQLLKARDLFRGNGASLAKSASSPLKRFIQSTEGAYLFAASVTPPDNMFPEDAPQARIFRMASAGSLSLGEQGLETYAHIDMLAASDDMADKLMKILEGMTAMLSLAETNDRYLGEFMNATTVTREKDMVTLKLAYGSSRLLTMVQSMQARQNPVERPAPRTPQQQMVQGRLAGEWIGEPSKAAPGANPSVRATHTIEGVSLVNGAVITLARQLNGAPGSRFERVEIAPVDASAQPLVFKAEFMRQTGNPRGGVQFEFPSTAGTYNLHVVYAANDPEGKAKYVVSVRDPRATPAAATPGASK